MPIKNILLIYKRSSYASYVLSGKTAIYRRVRASPLGERFRLTHKEHYQSLRLVEDCLRRRGIRYRKVNRGRRVDFSRYDLVITVGGDGTFLEAARHLHDQIILGVNSDPAWSVGRFCAADRQTFPDILDRILKGTMKITLLNRLRLRIDRLKLTAYGINDVLICHRNPAAMSRYVIRIGRREEEHRSSGVWIATPAGSTGAIHSAGGKVLSLISRRLQYKPRELYRSGRAYRLTGGVISPSRRIVVTSLMKEGRLYIDGPNEQLAFTFGEQVAFDGADRPLRAIELKD